VKLKLFIHYVSGSEFGKVLVPVTVSDSNQDLDPDHVY
jgi:hypothetical protein